MVYCIYPSPNLAREQVAYVRCDPKVIEIDGQTKSPRGVVYAVMHRTTATGPLKLQLPAGEHTFLLVAGRDSWGKPGTAVAGSHPEFVYTSPPVRFALKVTLEAGREDAVNLRVTRPNLKVGEAAILGGVSAIGFSSRVRNEAIRDVAILSDGKVVATAPPLANR